MLLQYFASSDTELVLFVLVKPPPRVCTENTALGGVSRQIQHSANVHTSVSSALTGI